MAYVIWRSDSPANVEGFDDLVSAYRTMQRAMAACHDRSIEWCLVKTHDDDTEWETVVCGRHGDF